MIRSTVVKNAEQGVRIIGMLLYSVEVCGLRQNQAIVFIHQHLASRGAGGERYAEFTGQECAERIRKERIKAGGVFHIADVAHADADSGAVDASATQGPTGGGDLQHTETVHGQGMGERPR